ncbi:MAG: HD domain-containing protein [Armatimonadetes bacterium]|nr:HD domain-containing protein [Armatimonadota bacterium]MDW8122974.1 HD domain-containing phosphohydrolase [Armatimonadota bacterium]
MTGQSSATFKNEVSDLKKEASDLQHEVSDLAAKLGEAWEELSLFYELSQSLVGNLDIEAAGRTLLQQARDRIDGEGAVILLQTPEEPWKVLEQTQPLKGNEWLSGPEAQSLAGRILRRNRPLILNQLSDGAVWQGVPLPVHWRSLLAVPINPKGSIQGILLVWNKRKGPFTAGDGKLLSAIATLAGGTMESAFLYRRLSDTYQGILVSLATAVDAKSRWTAGHSQRTTGYALALAEYMNLPADYLEKVRTSGLLHDIGKIGVPDAILDKPSDLTPEEFELMKQHPEIGYRILQGIRQFHGDILDGVLYHHERVDGRGYPKGLSGENIPFMGRLLAVADGFDAMISDRPYRPGKTKEEALEEIRTGAGTHWDKQLALKFVEMMKDRPLLKEDEINL